MAAAPSGVPSECVAQCPPSTVTIQPPPFILTIPGPSLVCPDQPLGIEQHNPCIRSGPGGGAPAANPPPSFYNFSSYYSRALPWTSSIYRSPYY